MMTIVTQTTLKDGTGRKWDEVMRERMRAVKEQPGWVGGQLLRSADEANKRVIVGTWKSRADWERWHKDPRFAETRRELDDLTTGPAEHWWHDVVLDVRQDGRSPGAKAAQTASKRGRTRPAKHRAR